MAAASAACAHTVVSRARPCQPQELRQRRPCAARRTTTHRSSGACTLAAPPRGAGACRAAGGGDPRDAGTPPPVSPPPAGVDSEPPWVRRERERELQAGAPQDLPFGLYLLFSTMVGIAAVGSIFEYAAKNPIFGVLGSDSVLYTPILGTFAITGLPMCAWLLVKGVAAANAESERYDKLDGL